MHLQDNLAELIKARRKVLGIKQEDLAELSGVGLRTVKSIETDSANPTWQTITALLDVLGLKIVFTTKL